LALATNANAIALTVGDVHYVGAIEDGIPPGGGVPSNELNWLNEIIALAAGTSAPSTNPAGENLNRSASTLAGPLPAPTTDTKSEPPLITYVVAGNSLYLLGKYASAASHVWYLGNIAVGTEVTLPDQALSHDTLFTGGRPPERVPEGGATAAMLGSALIGLTLLRRRLAA
jgi:hypothetical protein